MDIEQRITEVGLKQTLNEIEKAFVRRALNEGGSREVAGARLGVKRTTFLMMLKKHGLFVARPHAQAKRVLRLRGNE